jgi:hypothetical protein
MVCPQQIQRCRNQIQGEGGRRGAIKDEGGGGAGQVRGGTGAAVAPADGLLSMMAAVPTGRG